MQSVHCLHGCRCKLHAVAGAGADLPSPNSLPAALPGALRSGLLTARPAACRCRVPWQTEDATLQQHFSHYGPVEEAQIMREKYTGKSRGFGFVTFSSMGERARGAARAVESRQGVSRVCAGGGGEAPEALAARLRPLEQQRPHAAGGAPPPPPPPPHPPPAAADALAAVKAEHAIDGRKCEAKFALPEGKVGSARTTRIFVARIPASLTDSQFRQYFEQVRRGAAPLCRPQLPSCLPACC